jgi:phage terminase large subunit-like protein
MKDTERAGDLHLGVDIGRGGDKSVYVIRDNKQAQIVSENKSADLMAQVVETERIMKEHNISDNNVAIDDTGVGGGVTDRLKEKGYNVVGVRVGDSATEDKYKNIKAQMSWLSRMWLLGGGKLKPDERWYELLNIKYKEDTDGKLKIEPKEELSKRGIHSPDRADAFFLTFYPTPAEPKMRFL